MALGSDLADMLDVEVSFIETFQCFLNDVEGGKEFLQNGFYPLFRLFVVNFQSYRFKTVVLYLPDYGEEVGGSFVQSLLEIRLFGVLVLLNAPELELEAF